MGEAVAVSDRVYVLTNDGKVKLYLKGGVAYVADLGKDEMGSGTTVYAFASFSYNPDCLFLQPRLWRNKGIPVDSVLYPKPHPHKSWQCCKDDEGDTNSTVKWTDAAPSPSLIFIQYLKTISASSIFMNFSSPSHAGICRGKRWRL